MLTDAAGIPSDPPTAPSADAALLLAFTRLEAKVDVALTQHSADLKDLGRDRDDHEQRIRVLEARPTVSPKALWSAVASFLAIVFAGMPFLLRILGVG